MGWRGVFRAMAAAERRAQRARIAHAKQSERDAARRRKELLQQAAAMQAADEAVRARHEVQMFENYLDLVVSLHKDSWSPWDWQQVANGPPPARSQENERAAVAALQGYQPGLVDRATGNDKTKRAQLEAAILPARQQDALVYQQQYAQWEWYRRVGHGVVAGDIQAFRAVLDNLMPFEELEQLGTSVSVRSESPSYVEADVRVADADVIPTEEVKLLANGKLRNKSMAPGKYWALYQDHVCSPALRVGRELFALLPVPKAYVHVGRVGLNPATGHTDVLLLLSVAFDRASFMGLNFDRLDPSDAVAKYRPKMKFKKTTGFEPIEPLVPGRDISK